MPQSPAPTAKQLSYLRRLAEQTGTTFTPPQTRGQASREIKRLKALGDSSRDKLRRERTDVSRALAEDVPASSPDATEIIGYGSNCRWLR